MGFVGNSDKHLYPSELIFMIQIKKDEPTGSSFFYLLMGIFSDESNFVLFGNTFSLISQFLLS